MKSTGRRSSRAVAAMRSLSAANAGARLGARERGGRALPRTGLARDPERAPPARLHAPFGLVDPREVGGVAAARLGIGRRVHPFVVVGAGDIDRRETHAAADPHAVLD